MSKGVVILTPFYFDIWPYLTYVLLGQVFLFQLVLFGPVVEEENSLVKVNYIGDPSIGFDYRCAFAKFSCVNPANGMANSITECGKGGKGKRERERERE